MKYLRRSARPTDKAPNICHLGCAASCWPLILASSFLGCQPHPLPELVLPSPLPLILLQRALLHSRLQTAQVRGLTGWPRQASSPRQARGQVLLPVGRAAALPLRLSRLRARGSRSPLVTCAPVDVSVSDMTSQGVGPGGSFCGPGRAISALVSSHARRLAMWQSSIAASLPNSSRSLWGTGPCQLFLGPVHPYDPEP